MQLAVNPPVLPMLAKRVAEIPAGEGWIFEPKWDGFRVIVFRDGDEILLQSREGKPLDRYFPELHEPLKRQLPKRCVLDGEIVIASKAGLDFDALQNRLHPAASRVRRLAEQTPASIVFFDLLCEGGRDLRTSGLADRRKRLESMLAKADAPLHLTPATVDRQVALDWFHRFEGAGLDGVMAKALVGVYEPDRRAMLKVKHERDCDCVVAGFRWHKGVEEEEVGSLLLGLYTPSGSLQHVGVCASFTQKRRKELVEFLKSYRKRGRSGHPWAEEGGTAGARHLPAAESRWNRGKNMSWVALRPELVAEVAYDHMQGTRFRHIAQFRRWRIDRAPASCTYEQLEAVPAQELMHIFALAEPETTRRGR